MARAARPSGTVTFLFTDIEGSTKLLHELGVDAYEDALAEHRRLLRAAFVRHGGHEVDTQGDAFFVVFQTAPAALAAAAEGRDALAPTGMRVRIGLHTGAAHLTDEGYVGHDVHLGARIGAAGHGGQILLSRATRELVEAELEDLGEHRLKDFAEAVSIFQLGTEAFPPLKTISNTNLPRPASSFVGRERETAEVAALLRGEARLLTLTGPGGTGKTRLAVEAAAALLPDVRGGVFWIGLATLREPELVLDTVAQVIGSANGLAEHIGERELVLLLDNFEQLVAAAPELADLLEACPNLRLLVTSRERLRVRGELEYPVPPLAEAEAVELFARRAAAEPNATVATLCARLDHMPLAVELAAARATVLTPAQILERLGDRLDLLRGGRDADPRQQTLRATIAWSYDLLDPAERTLFARLAVFRGGWTLEAAEQVAGASLDALQALVEKSLARRTDRFWMFETIREFALEHLVASGEEAELRRRHAEHYLALAEGAVTGYTEAAVETLRVLDEERDNLRRALVSLSEPEADERLVRLAVALANYWGMRGLTREARRWLNAAVSSGAGEPRLRSQALAHAAGLAADQHDWEEAEALAAESRRVAEESGDTERALHALNLAGGIASQRGDLDRARAAYLEVKRHADERRDVTLQSYVATNLGVVAILAGDYGTALRHSEEALDLHRQRGSDAGVVTALGNCGWCALGLEDVDGAERWFREATEIGRRLADVWMIRGCALGLAAVASATGDSGRAACLLGGEARLRSEAEVELDAYEQAVRERTLAAAHAELGDEAFAAAHARGEAMSLDEVAERCLEGREA